MTLMMDLEEKLEVAKSAHDLVMTRNSEPVGWIRGHTKIGPVCQVRVTCYFNQYGIETQVPSMLKNGTSSWIVISRGPNRYVDESWHDQEDPPQDVAM